jgi:ferrous iron transport protein B
MISNLKIAIAGNPNCGKTTIFNAITGARQHVGNWPGVTVEKKSGYINQNSQRWDFVDLPGTYSLSSYSQEEVIAQNFLVNEKPDVVVNIVDASNLERNLYLTTQLIELGRPLVIALNMMDIAKDRGVEINIEQLGTLLGAPIVPIYQHSKSGVDDLLNKIERVANKTSKKTRHIRINYHRDIEAEIDKIQLALSDQILPDEKRWMSIKLIEKDEEVIHKLSTFNNQEEIHLLINQARKNIDNIFSDSPKAVFSDSRYGFIQGALKESVTHQQIDRIDLSKKIDEVLTNKYFGLPIFALMMWLTFKLTFDIGQLPMDLIDSLVSFIGHIVGQFLTDGSLLQSLIVDGIISGVGGIAIFLPNIFILFFIIALLEDSGYMSRIAFIMDRIMHTIGLHGKAFIPMVMGFGCNVPAIMGTRILETRRDRILAILINPFVSCSARLPVYVLMAGAFFPENAGNYIFGMYVLGIVIAILSGKLLNKTVLRGESPPFVMELPPYLLPKWKSVFIHTWERGSIFIRKMGGVILIGAIIIWALSTFPREIELSQDYAQKIEILSQESNISANQELIANLKNQRSSEIMENRFIGKVGKIIEPIISPLGFTWREGIALITGFVAKEIVVSTYGVIFGVGGEQDESSTGLIDSLRNSGMNPLIAFGFMVFTLIYTPCLATVAAIKRESSAKWALFSVVYSLTLAWLLAFMIYQIGGIFV